METITEAYKERLRARFEAKFVVSKDRFYKGTPCWEWIGAKTTDRNGRSYGHIKVLGKQEKAHRVALFLSDTPVPPDYVSDHLCRYTLCVNPQHIEAVSWEENNNRRILYNSQKTHCPAGHAYDEANTYNHPKGYRICRVCRCEHLRRFRRKE